MTKTKLVVIFIVIVGVLLAFWFVNNKKVVSLASPNSPSNIVEAVPEPEINTNVPKEVVYDVSTDLDSELESINPEVSDADFETLP